VAPTPTAVPNILTDPGYLFWAPLATTEPINTVVASKFTDAWAVAWISLGATEDGSEFNYETKVEPISVAEFFDPIRYSTTERSGSIAFNLTDFTLQNYNRALNGPAASVSVVTGTGTTQLNALTPATPGTERRCMLGWESLDNTMRIIMYQTIQGGTVKSAFKKAPNMAVIPCTFNFEIPTSGIPFKMYTAGATRA